MNEGTHSGKSTICLKAAVLQDQQKTVFLPSDIWYRLDKPNLTKEEEEEEEEEDEDEKEERSKKRKKEKEEYKKKENKKAKERINKK